MLRKWRKQWSTAKLLVYRAVSSQRHHIPQALASSPPHTQHCEAVRKRSCCVPSLSTPAGEYGDQWSEVSGFRGHKSDEKDSPCRAPPIEQQRPSPSYVTRLCQTRGGDRPSSRNNAQGRVTTWPAWQLDSPMQTAGGHPSSRQRHPAVTHPPLSGWSYPAKDFPLGARGVFLGLQGHVGMLVSPCHACEKETHRPTPTMKAILLQVFL